MPFPKLPLLLVILILFTALGLTSCADISRQKITLPPVTDPPIPQTVFGEATLTTGNNSNPALNFPKVPDDRPLTLDECLNIAQRVSPSLDSVDQAQMKAMWNRWQSITAFLPTASTSYSTTKYDDLANTSHANAQSVSGLTQYTWQTAVTQPLFTGGKNMASYLLAQLGMAEADIKKFQAREDLLLKVKQTYFSILASEKALEVAKTSVVNIKNHLNVATNFFNVGMASKNQVLEAEVELAKAVQNENTLSRDLMVNKAQLNILLHRVVGDPIQIVDTLKFTPFPLTLDQCLIAGLNDRPEIKLGHNQVKASAKNIDLAKANLYPQVDLVYTNTSLGNTPKAHGGWSNNDSNWSVSTIASINFWEWGRTKAEVEKSKVELNRSLNVLASLEDNTKLDITTNYHQLISAGLNIDVSAKAVIAAAEDLRMVNERYLEQMATNTDVLDSQTRYSQVQYDYYNALYSYNLAWATLERSLGRKVVAASPDNNQPDHQSATVQPG